MSPRCVARAFAVGLARLCADSRALHETAEWEGLSQGEMQRVSIGRLLARRPLVAVLDEPTSAVEPAFEAQIFAELAASRVTLLTVAHRPELAAYHTHELRLDGDGGSSFEIDSSG